MTDDEDHDHDHDDDYDGDDDDDNDDDDNYDDDSDDDDHDDDEMMMMMMTMIMQVEGKPVQAVQLIFCPNWPHLRFFKNIFLLVLAFIFVLVCPTLDLSLGICG